MAMTEEDYELISAGFSAILGFQVVPPSRGQGLPKLTVHELFECTYIPRSVQDIDQDDVFDIHVKTITGSTTTLQVTVDHTIANIKADVEIKLDVPARDMRLMFNGNPVEDHQSVMELGIPSGGILYLLIRAKGPGGGPDFQLDTSEFVPRFNYDFTLKKDDGSVYRRGGKVYKRPYGWKRYAVRALDRYENNAWLGVDGIRTQESHGEWPVSYHGTNLKSAQAIMKSGFKMGPRALHDKAVYSSPSLEKVERHYAQPFEHNGSSFKIALQNRINPAPDHFIVISKEETGVGAEYWLSPKQDVSQGIYDLRPYGILFKKVE